MHIKRRASNYFKINQNESFYIVSSVNFKKGKQSWVRAFIDCTEKKPICQLPPTT